MEFDERLQAEEVAPGNMGALQGEPARLVKNSRGEVAETRIVKTGKETLMFNNIGTQWGGLGEDNNGVAIGTSTPNSKPPIAPANSKPAGVLPVTSSPGSAGSPVLPSYPVGRGISLPFDQFLPKCDWCSCNALITWILRSDPKVSGALCFDHGLQSNSATRDLVMGNYPFYQYSFISPEHEAAIRAFLADGSGEDSEMFVDGPQAETEVVEKAADATTSGSDEWGDWSDEREVLHN